MRIQNKNEYRRELTIWHIFKNENFFQHWSSKSHANCDFFAFWLIVINIIKILHIISKQNIKLKHFVKHQSNNSFVYLHKKTWKIQKTHVKLIYIKKKTRKSHDISKSNINRHVKCLQFRMHFYSNVLRVFF